MTDQVILLAAAVGLVVNTLAILAVAWGGGRVLGKLETAVGILSDEVRSLRESRHEQSNLVQRAITTLDNLERRVERLEAATDRSTA